MKLILRIFLKITYYFPSFKRMTLLIFWGCFVYFIVVPFYFLMVFYKNPKFNFNHLKFSDENVDHAHVSFYAYNLKMVWFLGISADITVSSWDEKIKIKIPYSKWAHLEPFNIANSLEYKYFKENSVDCKKQSKNKLVIDAKILFHLGSFNIPYNRKKEIDIFGLKTDKKGDNNLIQVLTMTSAEEKDKLIVKAQLALKFPSFLDISLENFKIDFFEETSGKLINFVINLDYKGMANVLCTIDKENIKSFKKLLLKVDKKPKDCFDFAYLRFNSDNEADDSNYHKALRTILKTFIFELPNRYCDLENETLNLQNRSVLFDFLSPTLEEKSNILVTKVKVHESLFPINLLAHLCKVIPFENIPVCGKLNEKNILNGSITQLSKFDEEYFTLQINLEVLEGHKLFREFHSLDDKIFELKAIEDGSFASSIFSCISLFYNFKNAPVISSLPDLCMKPSISLSKSKVLENNCLNIYTMASTNDNSFLITNEIYSSTFVEGPISLNFPDDFEFEFCTGLKLRSSKNEISIDPSRPLVNAFSLKEKFKLELEINQEFDLLSFVFFIQNKVESQNENGDFSEFDDIITKMTFKVLKLFSICKYELEISTKGKKIINPLIEWEFCLQPPVKIQFNLMRCEDSYVLLKLQEKDSIDTMASCTLEFKDPTLKLHISENKVSFFPEIVKNKVIISLVFAKVLFYPFMVEFEESNSENSLSSLISKFLSDKNFKVDDQINKIHKEKTKYTPVTNISQSKFNFLNDISIELDSNKNTSKIKGNILCYYNEDIKINCTTADLYLQKIKNGTIKEHFENNQQKEPKKDLPIQIKQIEFSYLGNYLKIYDIELIPVNSNLIETQSQVVICISFDFDPFDFLHQNCEIKCKYGDEEFLIFYDLKEIKDCLSCFYNSQGKKEYSDKIDIYPLKNDNTNLQKSTNSFKNYALELIYEGDRLVYLDKLNKCIRRLNLSRYPSSINFNSTLKFLFKDLEYKINAESEFAAMYDNNNAVQKLKINFNIESSTIRPLEIEGRDMIFLFKKYILLIKNLKKGILSSFLSIFDFKLLKILSETKIYKYFTQKEEPGNNVNSSLKKTPNFTPIISPLLDSEIFYKSEFCLSFPKIQPTDESQTKDTISSKGNTLKVYYGIMKNGNLFFGYTLYSKNTIVLQDHLVITYSKIEILKIPYLCSIDAFSRTFFKNTCLRLYNLCKYFCV